MAAHDPLIPRNLTYRRLTERLSALVLKRRAPWSWLAAFAISAGLLLAFTATLIWLFWMVGVGIFGINIPVAWGVAITACIWWIGIAHAGTLISAVLLLTRQDWRASINRFAEAMAMFAIICAGLYPLIHLGRPEFFYYLIPYPNTMELWPQWRSPLIWDFFAISTYLIFTTIFLYMSVLPDLASLRDRAQGRAAQLFYGLLALGWRNSAVHWARYERANGVLAAVAAPIVFLVTGIISLDLAVIVLPGYHFTIFPAYFVAGALFSGFCTVALLAIVLRSMFGLHDLVTPTHFDYIGRMMLVFVLFVDYAYTQEMFTAWYSGEVAYRWVYIDRWTGPYAPVWWTMIIINMVVMQALWSKRVRRSAPLLLTLAIAGLVSMFLERFQIVFTTTHNGYLPSAWDTVWPSIWDWVVFAGSIGLFAFGFLFLIRVVPLISLHDLRSLVHKRRGDAPGDADG